MSRGSAAPVEAARADERAGRLLSNRPADAGAGGEEAVRSGDDLVRLLRRDERAGVEVIIAEVREN